MSACPSSAAGWPAAFRLFFTATVAMSRLSSPCTVMYRFISSAKIQSRFGPSGRSRMLSKIVRNAPCGCGWVEDIFSSATDEDDVGHAARDRVPRLDRGEDAAAAAHVRAHVWLAERAGAVGEVLPLHVHAVEHVRRAREADGLDVVQREAAGVQCCARRLPRQLLARLLRAAHEPRHPRAHDRDRCAIRRHHPSRGTR